MFDLNRFLLDREMRANRQKELILLHNKPLIVVRANYPGENKNSFVPNKITEIIFEEIKTLFQISYFEKIESLEGISFLAIVENEIGKNIKKITIEIEEAHILGRCVDIDVFDCNGYPFSRKDFNLEKRKCLICDNMAFICSRSMAHSHEEIIKKIEENLKIFLETEKKKEKLSNKYANFAVKAMILEVSSSPSFGLVSPKTQGGHDDMDFFTFIDSSFAISPFLKEFFSSGFSSLSLDLIFKKIREIGKKAEKEMFLATNNINTHKGMIFLMGIFLASLGKIKYDEKDLNSLSLTISTMCKDILKDFENLENKKNLSHGEKLFLNHGIIGIREIAKNGISIVFNGSLKIFEENIYLGINTAMIKTLIFLMKHLDDTTILYRHDFNVLLEVKKLASMLSEKEINLTELEKIESDFSKRKISPGGAADLLAITILLYFIKKND